MWDYSQGGDPNNPQPMQMPTPFPSSQPPYNPQGGYGYLGEAMTDTFTSASYPPTPGLASPTYIYERHVYYGNSPPLFPQTATYSNPYPPQPEIYERARAHSHSHHHSHSHPHSHSHSHSPHPPPPPPPPKTSLSKPPPPVKSTQTHKPPGHKLHSSQSVPQLNPFFQYSKCTGRKKALCIGINYKGQSNELRGCVNDARHVRDFLTSRCGYRPGDIVLLTDDSKNPRQQPTRQNILDAMRWLVRSAKTNDSLFFHYSGHGGQTKDITGDEIDGWDEVIFPLDFKKHGHIIDDEMHNIMVKPLPVGCRLTALFDSCHSGTVLDLPYIYSSHGRLKGSHVSDRNRKRLASPADVISWSGCKDDETSADTFAGGVAVGAMSYAFILSLTRKPKQTYQELLRSIRLILHPRFSQKPQIGSSHHIDTSLQFVI